MPHPAPFSATHASEFFRDHSEEFAGLTAHWGIPMRLTADDETEMVRGEWVLSNYFDVLGVKPLPGRPRQADEDELSNPKLAMVISHRLWTQRFRGDPNIIGKQVRLHDTYQEKHFTIVGVTSPEFKGVSDPWTPSEFWITFAQATGKNRIGFCPIARLKPGVSFQQAQAIFRTQGETLLAEKRKTASPRTLQAWQGRHFVALAANSVRMPFDPAASVIPTRLAAGMTVVVAMVLLIAVVRGRG